MASPAYLTSFHSTEARTQADRHTRSGVPWPLWTGAGALTSIWIGGAWDVAWHRSIGRDSFWTPAHLMIQLGAVLAGIVGVTLVYRATWGRTAADARLRRNSVNLLGLRAPLGIFIAGWGGAAMLTSAPFDNWWHNAYGLDVKIISPPHTLLVLGIRMVSVGFLFLLLAAMNQAHATTDPLQAESYRKLRALYLYLGGLVLIGQMFFLQEMDWEGLQHSAGAYIGIAIAVPIVFAAFAETARFRWTATSVAMVYTVGTIAEVLIFPLFPAHPKLGPVYFPVTHLVPATCPILLRAPALAFDLICRRGRSWKAWELAAAAGVLFVAVLVAVQWPFADFLMSKASANRFFGTGYFDFNARPGSYDRMRLFVHPQTGLPLLRGLSLAAVYATISTWVGLRFGRWAQGVQR